MNLGPRSLFRLLALAIAMEGMFALIHWVNHRGEAGTGVSVNTVCSPDPAAPVVLDGRQLPDCAGLARLALGFDDTAGDPTVPPAADFDENR